MLNAAIRDEFGLEPGKESEIYHVWESGGVIRLARSPTDSTCIITVTGQQFGREYVTHLLRSGIQRLF